MSHVKRFLSVLILSLLVAGCGGSDGSDGVLAGGGGAFGGGGGGGGGGAAGSGNLLFQFVQAQAAEVPTTTAFLQFTLYTGADGTGNVVFMTQTAFATSVLLQDVSTNAASVVIRALDANQVPVAVITNPVTVFNESTVLVNLSAAEVEEVEFTGLTVTPDPLEIDLNQTPPRLVLTGQFGTTDFEFDPETFTESATFSSNDNVLSVAADGTLTANDVGEGTLTVTYTVEGETQQDTVEFRIGVLQASPGTLNVTVGNTSQAQSVTFLDGDDALVDVTNSNNLSFAISPAVTGFSVDQDGRVTVAGSVTPGSTANLVATYQNSGRTFRDTVPVTAQPDVP